MLVNQRVHILHADKLERDGSKTHDFGENKPFTSYILRSGCQGFDSGDRPGSMGYSNTKHGDGLT